MNVITKTEVHAIETAAPLEVADLTKNLILVPLSQLLPRRSKRNVRTTPRQSIPELAASIARVGLLQNLIVILSADGEQYEVVAGDRRLTALKLLAKKKRIAANYEVPCLLVADASAALSASPRNVQREAMHPADQFAAFAALVEEARPIEDIAADFGVSPLVVQRRLKLANVSPRLMTDYRAGAATLEQLMALTITDDHAAQEAAFYGAPEWQRGASALRDPPDRARNYRRIRWCASSGWTLTRRRAAASAATCLRKAMPEPTSPMPRCWNRWCAASWICWPRKCAPRVGRGWKPCRMLSHAERQSFQNAPRQRREPRRPRSPPYRFAANPPRQNRHRTGRRLRRRERGQSGNAGRTPRTGGRGTASHRRLARLPRMCALWPVPSSRSACKRRGRDSSRPAAQAEAKALRTLEEAAAGFQRRRRRERRGRPRRRSAQGREPVRPTGAAVERASHGGTANRSRTASAYRAGDAGAWHGAGCLAAAYLPRRLAAGREPESARPRLESMAPDVPESPAAVALRALRQVAERSLAAWRQRRTVRRVAGESRKTS